MTFKSSRKGLSRFLSLSHIFRRKSSSTPATSSTTSSGLLALVPELIEEVVSFLDLDDLCVLRVTCTVLYNKTWSIFWRTSLRKIETDLSHYSLQRLETLSKNPQLRGYVHHLTFRGSDEMGYCFGDGFEWDRHESGHLIDLQKQPAVKLLRPILSRLVNCKSFECWSLDTPEYLDLGRITRATDAVQVILDIVAEARLPIASFTVNFQVNHNTAHGYLDPRRLNPVYFQKDGFGARWAQLENLTLDFMLSFDVVLTWTLDLILAAPNLKKLYINLDMHDNTPVFMQRLALTDRLVWHQLQELRLHNIRISSMTHLMALLHKCQLTLRVLHIRSLRTDTNVANMRAFFQTMSTSFPSLEEIDFGSWWSGSGRGLRDVNIVHYPGIPDNSTLDDAEKSRVKVVTRAHRQARWNRFVGYSGPQVHAVLEMLARSVDFLAWRSDRD